MEEDVPEIKIGKRAHFTGKRIMKSPGEAKNGSTSGACLQHRQTWPQK